MIWSLKQEKPQRQRRRSTHDFTERENIQRSQDDVNCKVAKLAVG